MNAKLMAVAPTPTEEDIHAYVDGFLDPGRRREIEAYLAAHPDEAERVRDYRAQNISLHQVLDGYGASPIPHSLELLSGKLRLALRRQRLLRAIARTAASVSLLAIVGGAGYWAYDRIAVRPDPLVAFTQDAAEAHLLYTDSAGPVPRHVADERANVVAWLSQRLTGAPLREPNLETFGFKLAAGRILPTRAGPAAQLMYRDKNGVAVTLFIGANQDSEQTRFTFVQEGKMSLFYWQNANFAYSLIGELDKDKLLTIAQLVSDELNSVQGVPGGIVPKDTDPARPGGLQEVSTPEIDKDASAD